MIPNPVCRPFMGNCFYIKMYIDGKKQNISCYSKQRKRPGMTHWSITTRRLRVRHEEVFLSTTSWVRVLLANYEKCNSEYFSLCGKKHILMLNMMKRHQRCTALFADSSQRLEKQLIFLWQRQLQKIPF